ncbi:tetratricopeptide repeat protein [Pseudofrankia sp. BMG5.37]|nr:tetratricopeptide repeat protein [Pseudofrankia sp. BMG5.37]
MRAASNLANALRQQGEYQEARALSRDVLAWYQRTAGEDHPDMIHAAGTLSSAILRGSGDYTAARALAEDVLARWRRVQGEDHPETIRAAGNLSAALWNLGEFKAARALDEDVLARRRRILGDDHPTRSTPQGTSRAPYRARGTIRPPRPVGGRACPVAADPRRRPPPHDPREGGISRS